MMLRDTAERLYTDAESDCAAGKQHGALDKYRKGALMQRRLNLLAAANAIEQLLGSGNQSSPEVGGVRAGALSAEDTLSHHLTLSPLPQTVEQAKAWLNHAIVDAAVNYRTERKSEYFAQVDSARDALIAACRAEAHAEIARLKKLQAQTVSGRQTPD